MTWLRRAAALCLLLLAAPIAAQQRPDRNCTDDRGVDRCAAEQQRRVRALFGARSIEEHEAAGDQIRRVFYVDGYGRDMVAISFVRAPGRDPTVFVHFPRREGEPASEPLQAPVPRAVWGDVLFRSAGFDRSFVPLAPGTTSICLHSWVYTIEASDPPRHGRPARTRRKTEDACQDGPGETYAVELERAALALLPHCAALDPEQHRNEASMLAACRTLSGDRMAAAEVLNRAGAFRRVHGPDEVNLIAGHFDLSRASVDWNGARHPAGSGAAAFWAAKMSEGGHTNFYVESVEGISADRVRLTGWLARGDGTRARVEQNWVFGTIQEYWIESATVGPFERVAQR